MNLLERMDRLVYATRLDRLVFMKIQPRTFRWLPLIAIVALVAGFALMAKSASPFDQRFLAGWLLFYGAFLGGTFLRVLGPRFAGTIRQPLDERELMIKARAHAVAGFVLATLAMLGCFYMGSMGVFGLWHPRPYDWFNLGMSLQAGVILLPTLVASWLEPRLAGDNDD